ncbi:hypothetical protein JCM24511_08451 [Saitozyma sp. JCM 24511]|nr:hypothetical protein JCM24511_08451 [Saitozyma sp. JCM 24511]
MSTVALTLPTAFPVVGLGIVSTVFLNLYQQFLVIKARKESGVSYPTLYVSEADAKADAKKMKYQCTQRANQNTLESIPFVLSLLLFLGLFHPRVATGFTLSWVVGRIAYTNGYSTGIAANRTKGVVGKLQYIGLLGLIFGSLYTAGEKTYALYF